MGLAGGIVRKVFSKSPCSSVGARGRNAKSSVDHKSRWSSLRLYLCGDEFNAAPEEEDEMVSVKSFETTAVQRVVQVSGDEQSNNADKYSEEPEDQGVAGENNVPAKSFSEEEAAILIQSAFKGFMARRQFKEMKRCAERDCREEPKSPTSPSIAASVEVQVGESLSNVRLSEESVTVQHRANPKARPSVFRVKQEWDDSTVSSNILKMRIQNKIEATSRRERAMAYAFSQQLRSCGGTKKRSARSDQTEFNVGWSWLERWMATRQTETPAEDCLSKYAADSASTGRRVIVTKKRHDFAVEERESCASNDVSVSFDGSNNTQNGMSCYKPAKNRLKSGRNLPRRKVASDHRCCQARSKKVSKKGHQREEQEQAMGQTETKYSDAFQPPTDY